MMDTSFNDNPGDKKHGSRSQSEIASRMRDAGYEDWEINEELAEKEWSEKTVSEHTAQFRSLGKLTDIEPTKSFDKSLNGLAQCRVQVSEIQAMLEKASGLTESIQKGNAMAEKKSVYLTLHESFVRTDIEYVDKATGELKTFNSMTLPKGVVVEDKDVGGFQFSPLYVNKSRYRGENYRDIPLLAEKEVWLTRTLLDSDNQPVLNEEGKPTKEILKVMPIKDAMDKQRSDYLEARKQQQSEQAKPAKAGFHQIIANAKAASEANDTPTSGEKTKDPAER